MARELTIGGVTIFVGLWTAGCVGLPYVPYEPAQAMEHPKGDVSDPASDG